MAEARRAVLAAAAGRPRSDKGEGGAAGVALYLLSPLDIIPDFIPVVGYLDDALVLLLGLWLFLRLCPRELFDEHVRRLKEEAAAGRQGRDTGRR